MGHTESQDLRGREFDLVITLALLWSVGLSEGHQDHNPLSSSPELAGTGQAGVKKQTLAPANPSGELGLQTLRERAGILGVIHSR